MSFFVSTPSFWQQSQAWRASQSNATGADKTTIGRLFGDKATSTNTADSLLGQFGTTIMNASAAAAVNAATQANDRIQKQAAKVKNNAPDKSDANITVQAVYTGSMSGLVDFGTAGPSPGGGFKFLAGDDLKTQFKAAVSAIKSNGDSIDTVTLSGNTIIASTSGLNAHPVFTLTLKPDSGTYTFILRNPIDMKTSRLDKSTTINLSGLVEAVTADGIATSPENSVLIQVHNGRGNAGSVKFQTKDDLGNVTGLATAGAVYQGGLAYTGPNNTPPAAKSKTPTKYAAPTNPLTGRGYSAASGAAAATFNTINIFA
jgi:hypothetical protein